MGADGGDVWPALPHELEETVKEHLSSSMRQLTEDPHGNPVATWVETGPDHFRHAHLYYTVAGSIMGGRSTWSSHLRAADADPEALQQRPYRAPKADDIQVVDVHGRPVALTRRGLLRSRRIPLPPGAIGPGVSLGW